MTAIMAITTSNSISVKAAFRSRCMALLLLRSWESAMFFPTRRLLSCKEYERLVVLPPGHASAQRSGGASATPARARAPPRKTVEHEPEGRGARRRPAVSPGHADP